MARRSLSSNPFSGADGRARLLAAISEQKLIQHNQSLAEMVADRVSICGFQPADVLMEQGELKHDIHFILSGSVEVQINGCVVGNRGQGDSLGEISLASPNNGRSATVIARTTTITARLTDSRFHEIASSYPEIWKPIAKVSAERLRERQKFHRPPNPVPTLFIGSSTEGKKHANAIANGLSPSLVKAVPWTQPGLFAPGGSTLETLLEVVDGADFAAFVFGADDRAAIRGHQYNIPRDNVVFELGLFMGAMDKRRAFIVCQSTTNIKIPTDLLGITQIRYSSKGRRSLANSVHPACREIETVVSQLGPRIWGPQRKA